MPDSKCNRRVLSDGAAKPDRIRNAADIHPLESRSKTSRLGNKSWTLPSEKQWEASEDFSVLTWARPLSSPAHICHHCGSMKWLNLPLRSSIQLCTVSGGWVSLMCFRASSRSTSPVGASDLQITCKFISEWQQPVTRYSYQRTVTEINTKMTNHHESAHITDGHSLLHQTLRVLTVSLDIECFGVHSPNFKYNFNYWWWTSKSFFWLIVINRASAGLSKSNSRLLKNILN